MFEMWRPICEIRHLLTYTVIRFVWFSAKFGTCTVVSVNGTLAEDKMRRLKSECEHFSFNKCPIYTHDGASPKFSTNSHETDNSVTLLCFCKQSTFLNCFLRKSAQTVISTSLNYKHMWHEHWTMLESIYLLHYYYVHTSCNFSRSLFLWTNDFPTPDSFCLVLSWADFH